MCTVFMRRLHAPTLPPVYQREGRGDNKSQAEVLHIVYLHAMDLSTVRHAGRNADRRKERDRPSTYTCTVDMYVFRVALEICMS